MARKAAEGAGEARKAFGALLQWHLKRGTRPPGAPALRHTDWSQKEFSGAVKRAGINGEATDRTIRNWCTGAALPNDLRPIERALFGAEPADPDNDGQAGQRHQLRRAFHLAKNGAPPPAEPAGALPMPSIVSDPGKCFGRELETAQLAASLLAPEGGSALVLGNAGHGKTMLTRMVALQPEIIARFGARRWFAALERAETHEAVLCEIAHAIGLDRDKAAWPAVHAALGSQPGLLVLDNLETPLHAPQQRAQIEQLLRDLTTVPGVAILASLRSQETVGAVSWTEVVLLEPLPPEVSRAMFLSIARTISAADPDLEFFVGKDGVVGGIPLAIHLVAHRVFRAASLAALRREWGRQGALLAAVSGGDGTRLDSLPASVAFSLASGRLKAVGRRLFSLLGQLPAGLGEEDRGAIFGDAGADAAAQLRSVGLLRDADDGRIGLLPPIRDIASRNYPTDPGDTQRWTSHYLKLLRSEGEKPGSLAGRAAVQRLSPEMPNIGAAISLLAQTSSNIEMIVGSLIALENSIKFTLYSPEIPLDHLGAACARTGNKIGEAHCLFILADRQRYKFLNDEAKSKFMAALDLLEGQAAPRLQGMCLWGLAEIHRVLEEYETASKFYPQARSCFHESGYRLGEAECLMGLGDIARQQDRYQDAAKLLEESNRLHDEAGSLRAKAMNCWLLADMARIREDPRSAQHWYEQARAIYVGIGAPAGEASCLLGFALVAAIQGDFEKADEILQDVHRISAYAGLIIGKVSILWGMAHLARKRGDPSIARGLYQEALAIYQELGVPSGQADCWFGLAAIAQARNDTVEAREFFERAIELYKDSGGLISKADCLHGLALVARSEGNTAAARENLTEALGLYSRATAPVGAERCMAELTVL
jgi:tetratricopeptide (TPR) repeat protein